MGSSIAISSCYEKMDFVIAGRLQSSTNERNESKDWTINEFLVQTGKNPETPKKS